LKVSRAEISSQPTVRVTSWKKRRDYLPAFTALDSQPKVGSVMFRKII